MNHKLSIRHIFGITLGALTMPSMVYANDGAIVVPVSPFTIIPFIVLLLSIAVMPFVRRHWWEKNYPIVSAVLGLSVIGYYLFVVNNAGRLLDTGFEYVSFIILIGSLFVVAGGIHIRMKGRSTPLTNVVFLAISALVTNVIGTTGASMIMIRPFLRVNKYRLRGFHVVFFIFIVSNMGGALTPIGDPPLFLGYLKGVPFFWVLEYAWHIWAFAIGAVLLIFFILDYASFRKFEATDDGDDERLLHEDAEVSGLFNLVFLAIIICAVFIQHPAGLREVLMIVAASCAYLMTSKEIHTKNDFNFHPLREVAILFFGIFATMVPALDWLELNARHIGISSPGQFFWGTGMLSSVLDNAPTYLSFMSAAIGLFVDQDVVSQVQHLITTRGADIASLVGNHSEEIRNTFGALMKYHPDLVAGGTVPIDDINISYLIGNHNVYLRSISMAAVFFGACTYIGNGPNFMVKSIAERAGAPVPNFVEYVAKYSIPVLIPVFAVIWLYWFS